MIPPPFPFPLSSYRLFPSGSHYSGTMYGRFTKGKKKKNVACFFSHPPYAALQKLDFGSKYLLSSFLTFTVSTARTE